jgi:hypothetical protein
MDPRTQLYFAIDNIHSPWVKENNTKVIPPDQQSGSDGIRKKKSRSPKYMAGSGYLDV